MDAIVSATTPPSNQNRVSFHTAQRVPNPPVDFVECHKQLIVGSLLLCSVFASEGIECAYRQVWDPLDPIGRTES
jgi:hypothetical protein